jgi:hypothetical protein
LWRPHDRAWKHFICSNWFFMTPSIATKFQYINSLLFSFFTHYMFRPLRAILRWDIQLDICSFLLIFLHFIYGTAFVAHNTSSNVEFCWFYNFLFLYLIW